MALSVFQNSVEYHEVLYKSNTKQTLQALVFSVTLTMKGTRPMSKLWTCIIKTNSIYTSIFIFMFLTDMQVVSNLIFCSLMYHYKMTWTISLTWNKML